VAGRKKHDDVLSKSDVITETFDKIYMYVLENLKLCIGAAAGVLIVIALIYGYVIYQDRKNDRIQYVLTQGIMAFEAYASNGDEQALKQAETSLQQVKADGRKGPRNISKLYLAKIASMKGQKEEAVKLYSEVAGDSSDSLLKGVAEKALQSAKTN
jgi:hypothetical protein